MFALGLVVLVGAGLWWREAGSDGRLLHALALTAPLAWVLTRFPLMVTGMASGIQVPFAPVLVFFLLTGYDPPLALLTWCVAALPAYLLDRRAWQSRVFNAGSSTLSALLATLVVTRIGTDRVVSPDQLLTVLAGAATYYVSDTVLSAVSIAVERRKPVWRELTDPGAAVGGALFLLVATLGYLAAAVNIAMPTWVATLTAVPGMAVVVAAWAWRRAHQSRRQQRELFEAAVHIHAATSVEELVRVVESHGTALVSGSRLEVRPTPPGPRETGCEVDDDHGSKRWLVAPVNINQQARQVDEVAIVSLASLASAAFLRLRITAETTRMALVDPLTGLPNRRAFTGRLEEAVAEGAAIAVLFVDLDGFKAVNDTLGHAAGDELLVESARRLRVTCGAGAFPARLGGDEFAIVLPDLFPGTADDVAVAVVESLHVPFLLAAGPATISASVGITASEPDDDADTLLSRADAAMYTAKRAGGDAHVLASSES
ncbi:diguanylate cyclase (GGDEF)-like protein [Kineococcus rhizosphaerae]|uniref:Diguanylate cyclase (GGDEF)-like protein n=1 Tax=Kineococcus rhizosphaerae TaxID=559628 RepID=A0A2T0R634_9ACTN|nr:diguanylate cyclase (GGDEF)-like protein [Kineococcus rhizosphaerae]